MLILLGLGGVVIVVALVARAVNGPKGPPIVQVAAGEGRASRQAPTPAPAPTSTCKAPSSLRTACKELVKKRLRAPSQAEFPGMFDDESPTTNEATCMSTYRSYVDAPNAFNAKIRTHFECTYTPKTDWVELKMLP